MVKVVRAAPACPSCPKQYRARVASERRARGETGEGRPRQRGDSAQTSMAPPARAIDSMVAKAAHTGRSALAAAITRGLGGWACAEPRARIWR